MIERNRIAFPLVAAGLMALLVWLSFGGVETGPPGAAPPVREPQARYYATAVEIRSTDTAGRPEFRLEADRGAYFPADDRWQMQSPRWRREADGDAHAWQGRAEQAELTPLPDGTRLLELTGSVVLHRDPPRPLRLSTEVLRLEPARDYAETERPVTLESPDSRLEGRGARAWLDEQRVELLANVRGHHDTNGTN
ncbi:LPS export ABC transporter periplasmic protein LptC [Arhodomonas sp. SL1]|uniref:LPS export ABC transporter periplasmic protein LptC n=1 Tax=Arhodomonas sp. SL1 TaxID=3425691 RepID=UPI003F8828A0